MTISIIGAGAGVGLEAVKQALERGHDVVALSRHPGNIPDHIRLKKIAGKSARYPGLTWRIT